ncbi:MAG TPA: hypothetical protein VIH09_02150 [Flavobacterium sp.]|uniref:hypothetical protein n=1 Tax=Flavobacterium sp. TaxID=239 RepID=UPI002F415687
MELKKTLLITVVLSLIGLTIWEIYWRSKGYYPTIDDNKSLWAVQRDKIEALAKDDVILLGSSRVLFDIQIYQWEQVTGRRPIQLASAGSTPLPSFRDIVRNTDFAGTIIVGVTPGLFFSTTSPMAPPWKSIQEKVDYFKDFTYAQRLNHALSIPLQKNITFLSDVEGIDGINLKELLKKIKLGEPVKNAMPPFHEFSDIDENRNNRMTKKTATDTAFANTVKKVWQFFGKDSKPLEKEATMSYFLEDAKIFKARGGNLILLRCPSTGYYKIGEAKFAPRKEFWDVLVKRAQVKSYHYQDYDWLNHFDCPEWSHLSANDAETFTLALAKIMMKDYALSNRKK